MNRFLALLVAAALIGGCRDHHETAPADVTPPAAPRGLRSVTGDHEVFLSWLQNTERDVAGYRIYIADCGEPDCLYDPVGETSATYFTVSQLANGQKRYFAVLAYDKAGNKSDLSYDTVFDTPRPEGFGLQLASYYTDSLLAGYDFSGYTVLAYNDLSTDVFFAGRNGSYLMFAPYSDTEIQDAGYATTLDAVDYAPLEGWSPTGSVELIVGHCYIVFIKSANQQDNHYAKFRVTAVSNAQVTMDWAYQVDPGNQELRARPVAHAGGHRERRPIVLGG